jgi:hypothetical protein
MNLYMTSAWSQLQWWASVSFGVLALARFAAKDLRRWHVIGVSILYVAYTVYCVINTLMLTNYAGGFFRELQAQREAGDLAPPVSRAMGFANSLNAPAVLTFFVCLVGLFLVSLTYLWGAHLKGRKSA